MLTIFFINTVGLFNSCTQLQNQVRRKGCGKGEGVVLCFGWATKQDNGEKTKQGTTMESRATPLYVNASKAAWMPSQPQRTALPTSHPRIQSSRLPFLTTPHRYLYIYYIPHLCKCSLFKDDFFKGKESPNSNYLIYTAAMQMIPIQGLFFEGKESLNSNYLIYIAAMQMFPIRGLF